jgi:DNA processing protein
MTDKKLLSELRPWVKLLKLKGFGYASFQRLQENPAFQVDQLEHYSAAELATLGFTPEQTKQLSFDIRAELDELADWLAKAHNSHILHLHSKRYPKQLASIPSPPFLLFVQGNSDILHSKQMAIVGSRNPSLSGKDQARAFAKELAEMGWTITSGLALGIDGAAHSGALECQGNTIAVLGSGLNLLYPKRHSKLAEDILENGGCLVSEFFPNVAPLAHHFPRRNRVVSGLSEGSLVVEATEKSGSLITARYALEQGREVFAVPGNIRNPQAAGCHSLIQQGAKLVTSLQDIVDEFSFFQSSHSKVERSISQKSGTQGLAIDPLLDSVDYEVTPLDLIAERSGLPVSEVMMKLLEYELQGLISAVSGGYTRLT